MPNLTVKDVRPFVPARDFEASRAFYVELGWTELWCEDGLALLSLGDSQFLLQDFYVKDWAENSMLTVEVVSAVDWYDHVSTVLARGEHDPARVSAPKDEGWAIVTHVWDPSGVLLHVAQQPQSEG